jgi:hypothetical protein
MCATAGIMYIAMLMSEPTKEVVSIEPDKGTAAAMINTKPTMANL